MFYKSGTSHATAAVILLMRFTALGDRHQKATESHHLTTIANQGVSKNITLRPSALR